MGFTEGFAEGFAAPWLSARTSPLNRLSTRLRDGGVLEALEVLGALGVLLALLVPDDRTLLALGLSGRLATRARLAIDAVRLN